MKAKRALHQVQIVLCLPMPSEAFIAEMMFAFMTYEIGGTANIIISVPNYNCRNSFL